MEVIYSLRKTRGNNATLMYDHLNRINGLTNIVFNEIFSGEKKERTLTQENILLKQR